MKPAWTGLDSKLEPSSYAIMDSEEIPDDRQETLDDVEAPELAKQTGAVLASSDWTTQTILDQLRRGNIDLNPVFQRRDAWKPSRKSQFIESLILGLPVPQLVLAERKEKRGSYIIIDGKQRLLTLRQFAAEPGSLFNRLRLEQLRVLSELNGLSYLDLQTTTELEPQLTAFDNQTIRTVVIRNWPNENFLYTVFLRLNTGSVPLSPQELRQALHPGRFTQLVNEYSGNSEILREVLKLDRPDFRMRDTEVVVRYLSFRNFLHLYRGNLKPFLDNTVIHFNQDWESHEELVKKQVDDFERALVLSTDVFGKEHAFRKWNGTAFERPLNRAVFDAIMHYFDDASIGDLARAKKDEIVAAFKSLCSNDEDFRASIEGTTKSIDAILTRLQKWGVRLEEVLGRKLSIPSTVGKSKPD